ncbi:hypothetical protein [Streptomyces sp. NPDC054797]
MATTTLFGEIGNDRLEGNSGNDYVHGGEGADKCRGEREVHCER